MQITLESLNDSDFLREYFFKKCAQETIIDKFITSKYKYRTIQ